MGDVTQLEPQTEPRDLRAAFQIELEQSGLSTARASEQIGRHASSITRWLNGAYTGDNEAVTADVERLQLPHLEVTFARTARPRLPEDIGP